MKMKSVVTLFVALLLLNLEGKTFDEIVEKNKKIVSELWANNVTYPHSGSQDRILIFASDVTPVAWDGHNTIAAFIERGKGRAFLVSGPVVNALRSKDCNDFCQQWKRVLFNGNVRDIEYVNDYFNQDKSRRCKENAIWLNWQSQGYETDELYEDWVEGRVGPLIIQYHMMHADQMPNPHMVGQMCVRMGVVFSWPFWKNDIQTQNFVYDETIGIELSDGLRLKAYTKDPKYIDMYKTKVNPTGINFWTRRATYIKVFAEDIYEFLAKYDELFEENLITWNNQISTTSTHLPFSIDMFKIYTKWSYCQTLRYIDEERLSALTYSFAIAGNYNGDKSLKEPKIGNYTVTINAFGNYQHMPSGLDAKPHSIIRYKLLSERTNFRVIIATLFDSLYGHTTLRKSPAGPLETESSDEGYLYTPNGGQIHIDTKGFKGEFKIQFENVFPTVTFDPTNEETWSQWDTKEYNQTRANYALLICDTIYLSVQKDYLLQFNLNDMKEICHTYDNVLKSFGNFMGWGYKERERLHLSFDPQPAYGQAHAGHPIVCPLSWRDELNNLRNHYLKGTDVSQHWGMLHEIGHMFQPRHWTFSGFGETTNNFLILMFHQNFFKYNFEPMGGDHPKVLNWITYGKEAKFWLYLHWMYHIVPSFGWGLYSNIFHDMIEEGGHDYSFERYMRKFAKHSGHNIVPYVYYFRMHSFLKDPMATYKEFEHLPVFKPYDYLIKTTEGRWEETKEYFGFTNDVQVNVTTPFKYELTENFNTFIRMKTPSIEKS